MAVKEADSAARWSSEGDCERNGVVVIVVERVGFVSGDVERGGWGNEYEPSPFSEYSISASGLNDVALDAALVFDSMDSANETRRPWKTKASEIGDVGVVGDEGSSVSVFSGVRAAIAAM
jgi:hypothetical protein